MAERKRTHFTVDPRDDVTWRLRHSAWMLPVIFGMGVLAWTGFAYVAWRTRHTVWIAVTVFLLVGAVAVTFWPEGAAAGATTALLALWAAAVALAFVMRSQYINWCAQREFGFDPEAWSPENTRPDPADEAGEAGGSGEAGEPNSPR